MQRFLYGSFLEIVAWSPSPPPSSWVDAICNGKGMQDDAGSRLTSSPWVVGLQVNDACLLRPIYAAHARGKDWRCLCGKAQSLQEKGCQHVSKISAREMWQGEKCPCTIPVTEILTSTPCNLESNTHSHRQETSGTYDIISLDAPKFMYCKSLS